MEAVESRVVEIAKNIVRMTTNSGSGHPSSALSLAHLVASLMYRQMRYDLNDPWNLANDRLVLSEGHAVPVVYAAYADLHGVVGKSPAEGRQLTLQDLNTLRAIDSMLDGHPNPAEGMPFFDAATGSLGQGVSAGAGLALAARLDKLDKRIFVLIGDGESREGQIWEGLDFIIDHQLTHVCPIFNCNNQGQANYVSGQQSPETIAAKLKGYNFHVEIVDGHNLTAIMDALNMVGNDKCIAIVAETEKGWAVDSLKAHTNHGKPLPKEALAEAEASIDRTAAKLKIKVGLPAPQPPKPAKTLKAQPTLNIQIAPFAEGIKQAGMADAVAKNKLSTRRAYGAALLALGHADRRVVALDADVSNSTFSEIFAKAFPDRFFECKIAEQNMISVAVGLAAGGKIPFASSFAKFLVRGYDQVDMASITRANIKLCGSHSGVSLGPDGPSQMGLTDLAFFRAHASAHNGRGGRNATLFLPSDAVSAYALTQLAANTTGIGYIRTHRSDVPLLYPQNATFTLDGSAQLAQGDKLTLVTSGYMTAVGVPLVRELEKAGISCNLFDVYCLPVNCAPIFAAAKKAGGTILTVEDNYAGGVHAALAEKAAETGEVRVHGMTCQRVPKSGQTAEEILALVGLSNADIIAKVKSLIG